jgi:Uma2 family endonuclease
LIFPEKKRIIFPVRELVNTDKQKPFVLVIQGDNGAMALTRSTPNKKNYGDYLAWPEGARIEIIDGEIVDMGPAPSRRHQEVSGNIFAMLHRQLRGSGCRVYHAPFDVRLPSKGESDAHISTVVQPDIAVVCDAKKLDDKGCKGPPDAIFEIVSPASASNDHIRKLSLYEKHGVKEYWIVHPEHKIVLRRVLGENGKFLAAEAFDGTAVTPSVVFRELSIDWGEAFATD